MIIKGTEREQSLPTSFYFSDHYFSMRQLCSFAHQLHDIYSLAPRRVVEVGIGSGFVSSYLRRAGIDVLTVDLNAALQPDICAPISQLPTALAGRSFDLAVCCEVLEHMPFAAFDENIRILRGLSDRLYLTLPTYGKCFGAGGFLALPKCALRLMGLHIPLRLRREHELEEHFWEIGSSRETRRPELLRILQKHYAHVHNKRYALNPYHHSFVASDGNSAYLSGGSRGRSPSQDQNHAPMEGERPSSRSDDHHTRPLQTD